MSDYNYEQEAWEQGNGNTPAKAIDIKLMQKGDTQFIMPTRASDGSAAYDVFIPKKTPLRYGRQIIPLGFAIEMPQHIALDCRTRSGYSAKGLIAYQEGSGMELRIDADVQLGLIDSDYRGEVCAILNVRDPRIHTFPMYLAFGQAVAQMKFCYVPQTRLQVVKELSTTERGENGFGKHNNE